MSRGVVEPFDRLPSKVYFYPAIGLYLISALCLGSMFLTNSYDIASTLEPIVFYSGVAGAIALGVALVKLISKELDPRNPQAGTSHVYTRLGIILLVASLVAGIFTLVPGLVLVIIGSNKKNQVVQPSKAGKITLMVVSFLGGGIGGFIVAFILYFIAAERACELSSSKCY